MPCKLEQLERRRLLSTASVVGLTPIDADTDQPVPGLHLPNGVTVDPAAVARPDGAIASTTDGPLYQSFRFGSSFDFAQDVADGLYTLTLHFAEPDFKHVGQRKFDVFAENSLILDDCDIVADAGKRAAI